MKNLKVKNKLLAGFGVIIVLILVIAYLSISGVTSLNYWCDTLAEKTLVNTQSVWELRHNTLSGTRYLLMAFMEQDQNQINNYLDLAEKDTAANEELLNKYGKNHRVDQELVDSLNDTFAHQKEVRQKIIQMMKSGDEEAKTQAHAIYMQEFYPLLSTQNDILAKIHNQQMQLADRQIDLVHKVYRGTMIITIAMVAASIIISLIIIRMLVRAIVPPLNQIQKATNALAQGDFSVEVDYESRDELGETCDSIRSSFAELKRIINITASNLAQVAAGNFALEGEANFPGEVKEIEIAGVNLIKKMNKLFGEIRSSSTQINGGAAQVSNGAQALAQGATEQAASIEELSASISDISNNVNINAENSKKANELATASGEVAKSTMSDMEEMLRAMGEISASAQNIGKVIKVIDDITFQTNILSLNAAVEAARAGVAGKGFAVVADEVRNLAQKSSESAKEITALIEQAIDSVRQGENIAKKTSEAFHGLAGSINEVIDTVNEIAIASEEQASSINQITIGVDQISAVVQTNSATSEESAAASEELSSQAHVLDELLMQFKVKDEFSTESFMDKAPRSEPQDSSFELSGYDKY